MPEASTEIRLAPQQRHLWRLQAESRAYRVQAAVTLTGKVGSVGSASSVDAAALQAALTAVLGRHEAPAVRFHRAPGVRYPQQIVGDAVPPLWQAVDLSAQEPAAREAACDERWQQMMRRPFDVERGPLAHACLLTLAADHHQLILALPALVADRASLHLLLREVAEAYGGCQESAAEAAPFSQVAEWQGELLLSDESRAGREFWREQERAGIYTLRLPLEGKTGGGFAPESVAVELPAGAAMGVAALARRLDARPAAVLLAVWQTLVARLAGQAETGVGLVLDGRQQDDLRATVGPLARAVPMPFAAAPGDTVESLVRRVESAWREAVDWQDCFAADDGERAPSGFPAGFELASWPPPVVAAGVTFELLRQVAYGERFRVCLVVAERPAGPTLELHYDSRLFDAAYARTLGERLTVLLAAALAHPDRALAGVEVLGESERRQLAAWSAGPAASYPDVRLHQLVAAQAERTPAATAVVFAGAELTYRELEGRANQLARHLRRLGVGPETRVGVCLERSLDLVVALYAVLKAGGAYVPLDPAYPAERLLYMLEDSAVPVLVSSAAVLSALGELGAATAGPGAGAPAIVRMEAPEIEGESAAPLADAAVAADGLAYVIYTSGSTGRPKGAMNSHRAIVNRLLWMQEEYGLTAADRVLQKTPFSFDVSVWEFFWPLVAGARLVVASPGRHQDPAYLVDTIALQGITTLHFVPSMLHAFVEAAGVERCTGLVRVIASGEALPFELTRRFFARLPAALHNLYGPTEAAVDVTAWACERDGARQAVPIGRPVANTRIHLLDRDLRPVPAGVGGELYIGGVQVGRGYHGRPELTAERFLPDPFAGASGLRLYRSGDLARHDGEGAVEYLGRADHQVKIRGFRIELGEIEAALAAHPAVRETAVLAREDTPGDRRLVAYLTTDHEPPPTVDELRRFLTAKLPEFMVPAAFLRLPALPLQANGKLDRAALPAPGSERPDLEREYVAPRSPLEETLAAIWQEVLGIEKIGVLDSFFALGGDSMRSVRVVALAKEQGLTVSVEQLFRRQTIATLAEDLAAAAQSAAAAGGDDDLARLVAELEGLSDEEVAARLAGGGEAE